MSGAGAGVPVPLTVIVTELSSASFDGMSNVSFDVAEAVGEYLTVRVQVPEAAIVWPEQLSVVMLKGAAIGFALAMVPMVRLASPSFVTVTVLSDVLLI